MKKLLFTICLLAGVMLGGLQAYSSTSDFNTNRLLTNKIFDFGYSSNSIVNGNYISSVGSYMMSSTAPKIVGVIGQGIWPNKISRELTASSLSQVNLTTSLSTNTPVTFCESFILDKNNTDFFKWSTVPTIFALTNIDATFRLGFYPQGTATNRKLSLYYITPKNSYTDTAVTDYAMPLGKWQRLCYSNDVINKSTKMYLNGSLIKEFASSTFDYSYPSANLYFRIGESTEGARWGSYGHDNTVGWNRVLSASEILADYNLSKGSIQGRKPSLLFSENFYNEADATTNNITLYNTPTFNTNGITFNGSNQYADYNTTIAYPTGFTWAFDVYKNGNGGVIVGSTSASFPGIRILSDKIIVYLNSGRYKYSSATLTTGKKYRVVVTTDNTVSGSNIYIDGVLSNGTASDTGDAPLPWTGLRVGRAGTAYLNGSVKNVRLWNRILTSEEAIKASKNPYYSINKSVVDFSPTSKVANGIIFKVSFNGSNPLATSSSTVNLSTEGTVGYRSGIVGQGGSLTKDNGTWYTDKINLGIPANFTHLQYVKARPQNNSSARIMQYTNIYTLVFAGANLSALYYQSDTTLRTSVTWPNFPLNQWVCLAYTKVGSVGTFYNNGVFVASSSIGDGTLATSSNVYAIGGINGSSNRDFNGDQDEIEVRNYVMTPAEITNWCKVNK